MKRGAARLASPSSAALFTPSSFAPTIPYRYSPWRVAAKGSYKLIMSDSTHIHDPLISNDDR